MSEKALKSKISKLESQLGVKNKEIDNHLLKIEELEEKIMVLDELFPEEGVVETKKQAKQRTDSKLAMDLVEKDKQIRELKNKMGFLRKEKIQLQRELEQYTKKHSMVIRIEEKKEPLETLVKELNLKINKQQTLIKKLKEEINKDEISALKAKIADLNKKLDHARSISRIIGEDSKSKKTKKIQEKLKTTTKKRKVRKLKKKLNKRTGKEKKRVDHKGEQKPSYLSKKIEDLRKEVNSKNIKIKELRKEISSLEKSQARLASSISGGSPKDSFKALSEELQRKLNTSKKQISSLQKQIKEYKVWKAPVEQDSQQEIIDELRSKLEKLLTQEAEAGESEGNRGPVRVVMEDDLDLALRVRELKNMVEDLQKQNIQQRIEISALRKK